MQTSTSELALNTPFNTFLLSLIPEHLRPFVYIAGGFVADPGKAADIDLWVTGVDDPIKGVREIRNLNAGGLVLDDRDIQDYDEEGMFKIAGTLFDADHLPVQVLVTTYGINDLLGHFDISTHCIARHVASNTTLVGPKFTPTSALPQVLRNNTPSSTLLRYLRLVKRYGFRPDHTVVTTLANLYAQNSLRAEADWPFSR